MTAAVSNQVPSKRAATKMQAQSISLSANQHSNALITMTFCRHMNICLQEGGIIKYWTGVHEASSLLCCLFMLYNRLSEVLLVASCDS